VTPNSNLFDEVEVTMSGLAGDLTLRFSDLVDEGTKTATMRTAPGLYVVQSAPPPITASHTVDSMYNVTAGLVDTCGDHGCVFIRRHD
jgi:hypothetical protein